MIKFANLRAVHVGAYHAFSRWRVNPQSPWNIHLRWLSYALTRERYIQVQNHENKKAGNHQNINLDDCPIIIWYVLSLFVSSAPGLLFHFLPESYQCYALLLHSLAYLFLPGDTRNMPFSFLPVSQNM